MCLIVTETFALNFMSRLLILKLHSPICDETRKLYSFQYVFFMSGMKDSK